MGSLASNEFWLWLNTVTLAYVPFASQKNKQNNFKTNVKNVKDKKI